MGAQDTVKVSKIQKLLKAYGSQKSRQHGSHIAFTKQGIARPLILPLHGKEIPFYITKEIAKLLNMTKKDFLKALNKFK